MSKIKMKIKIKIKVRVAGEYLKDVERLELAPLPDKGGVKRVQGHTIDE